MKKLVLIAFSLVAFIFSGCKEDDDPPELPPAESLGLDLDSINAAPDDAKNAPTEELTAVPEDYRNFANAWVRVKVVQFFAGALIVVPALAMGSALSEEPETVEDKWVWTVVVLGNTIELEVEASLVSGFDVELYVTNNNLDRYLWVEGNFGDGSGTGEWVLHDPAIDGDDRALSIQWTYVSATDRSLTYEVLSSRPIAGETHTGDTFTYSVDGTTATLAYVDADDASVTAEIAWDTTTGAGSILVPGYNGGAIACWDQQFENAACP